MITLVMVSETIDRLRRRAADQHHNMRMDLRDDPSAGTNYWFWAVDRQVESERLYALAMTWHDVIRGCRTDAELLERLSRAALEHWLDRDSPVVEAWE